MQRKKILMSKFFLELELIILKKTLFYVYVYTHTGDSEAQSRYQILRTGVMGSFELPYMAGC